MLQVGTKLTDNGIVVASTVSAYGLYKAVIEAEGVYPSLEAWCAMLDRVPLRHDYSERVSGRRFVGVLVLYWKEPHPPVTEYGDIPPNAKSAFRGNEKEC